MTVAEWLRWRHIATRSLSCATHDAIDHVSVVRVGLDTQAHTRERIHPH